MTYPTFIEIDGKRVLWREIVQRRREQLEGGGEGRAACPVRAEGRYAAGMRAHRRAALSGAVVVHPPGRGGLSDGQGTALRHPSAHHRPDRRGDRARRRRIPPALGIAPAAASCARSTSRRGSATAASTSSRFALRPRRRATHQDRGHLQANFGAYSQQVERARQLSTLAPVFDLRLGRCEDCRRGLDDLNANCIGKEWRQNLKQRGSKGFNFHSQNRRRGRRSRQCPFNQRHRRDVVPATDLDPRRSL